MRPNCPFCKGHDIAEMDTVLALAGVLEVHLDDRGLEFDGMSEVDWNTQKPIRAKKRFECQDCYKEFTLAQLQKASLRALPKWLRKWLRQGDDMKCPSCGKKQLKTQDGITYCYACEWHAENSEAR